MSNPASPSTLRRHFVTVRGAFGTRQVHYRRGGEGPVVLLLHQSPQSSREMEPLIGAWGHAFTLIAPDSPGYGSSDPLQRRGEPLTTASIDDFAMATLEFASALGISRFGIYGFHTGASIATALAAAHPARVAAVAANGLVVLTHAERSNILRDYLPPLVPRWDGGHLAWLWGRLREQTIFFPWHDRRAATRMHFDVPPADRLQLGLNEFLAAGEHYAVAYTAAFTDPTDRHLATLGVPLLVTAAARDPLAGHLGRIGARSASVQVAPAADSADALAKAFAHLAAHPGTAGVPADAAELEPPPAASSTYWGMPGQQVRILTIAHRVAGTPHRTVVLLHAPGSSAGALDALAGQIAGAAEVLIPDLPGHGASDPLTAAGSAGSALSGTVAQLAEALGAALAGTSPTVVSTGDSAPLALELGPRLGPGTDIILLPPSTRSVADQDDWLRLGLPSLTPVWSGGHLLEAWHMVRDGRLFQPWFRREHAGIRPGEPDLDDQGIQREVRDLLRANGAWQPLLRDLIACRPRFSGPGVPPVRVLDAPPTSWAGVLVREPAGPGAPKLTH